MDYKASRTNVFKLLYRGNVTSRGNLPAEWTTELLTTSTRSKTGKLFKLQRTKRDKFTGKSLQEVNDK